MMPVLRQMSGSAGPTTLNLANDHVPSAIDEMYWTAENAELLKQEAGIRAGGREAENVVKHVSLNWAPDERPTREHMIETTEDFSPPHEMGRAPGGWWWRMKTRLIRMCM